MSRSERLLQLMQLLRRYRVPVSGRTLANELGVSLRTVYRDIGSLQAHGAHLDGEPGVGYLLRPGFLLPPLMFSEDELEALVLGARWVSKRADKRLSLAAQDAFAKISAVLPVDLRNSVEENTLLVGPRDTTDRERVDVAVVRRAIRDELKLQIEYVDQNGRSSQRTVWPIAIGYFENSRILVAWCEEREGFRHFRTDRISEVTPIGSRYPRRKHVLVREWRRTQGVSSSTDRI